MPAIVIASSSRRKPTDATDIVPPLPMPAKRTEARPVGSVVVDPSLLAAGRKSARRRNWIVGSTMAGAAILVVLGIGFSSNGMAQDSAVADHKLVEPGATAPVMPPASAVDALKPPPPAAAPGTVPGVEVAARAELPPPPVVPAPEIARVGESDDAPASTDAAPVRRSRAPRLVAAPSDPPSHASSATHRPAAKPARASSKPSRTRPATYDPDALFLNKP